MKIDNSLSQNSNTVPKNLESELHAVAAESNTPKENKVAVEDKAER